MSYTQYSLVAVLLQDTRWSRGRMARAVQ